MIQFRWEFKTDNHNIAFGIHKNISRNNDEADKIEVVSNFVYKFEIAGKFQVRNVIFFPIRLLYYAVIATCIPK